MKIFVSSLISGFEPFRASCRAAVSTLRHEPVMAEDFGARSQSPQEACLGGVRDSNLILLILGERYGAVQPRSGLSATHEEYREARGQKQIIAFVQAHMTPDPAQDAFIKEVQGWEGGLHRGSFSTPEELRDGVTRALYDYALANQAAPVDPAGLVADAQTLLPQAQRNVSRAPLLALAFASGPVRNILRPAEIEDQALVDAIHQSAMFGETQIFDRRAGIDTRLNGPALIITQDDGRQVQLDEQGRLLLQLGLSERHEHRRSFGFPALIQEVVLARIQTGLNFAAWMLDHVDPTRRLTHVGIAARIEAGHHMAWRTQREQDESPDSGTMGWGREDKPAVVVHKPRASLSYEVRKLAEDILVPLRRTWKQR